MSNNHVIDPTFFYELINRFSFDYEIYIRTGQTVNDAGYQVQTYEKQTISGSLQTQGISKAIRKTGTTESAEYKFYCKSLYRVQLGDVIHYNNLWMLCNDVHAYDEYGVREATFKVVQLTAYTDLQSYIKFLEGKEIV